MSTESNCICGHAEAGHGALTKQCYGANDIDTPNEERDDCECSMFRPVVPWPTEEGWWWCKYISKDYGIEAVSCRLMDGELEVYGKRYHDDCHSEYDTWLSESEWDEEYHECKFVKLLEQPPTFAEPSL